ncbi:family 10 glycosylhydrolase [Algoriphagus sp. CAU 1675]|uniref:glycoside hydrolase family 10 protein n=1 Tax=Algoriphagus sp. CAU 1675 TaxID=3032597 RepID=UPI0023DBD8DB|nr:family 10 glycosylhydrolase [Algoriphagus sp. CAU 1675]MDF2159140.1 family 10 glycosylhydrolase [Algoriphagus sp. CAU 1675]
MRTLSRFFGIILFSTVLLLSCKTQQNSHRTLGKTGIESTIPAKPEQQLPSKPIPSAAIALQPLNVDLPEIPREFRGVWIATVMNIDWPERGTDSWEKQKKDFKTLLDYYKDLNFNTVIVQIRAAGDAFYPSSLAPWSRYLTGKEGQAPATRENPLTWMIQEAHKRGLEFHAWLNPYRATFDLKTESLSPDHDFNKHRDWMLKYGSKYYYNPGLPEVKSHLTAIIKEIVDNYQIDAIHFDDYFYPYKVGTEIFPDKKTYEQYKKAGQSIEDWRRANVNDLVEAAHHTIKSSKPWVQFGISPFGVWRNQDKDPNGSATRAGQTNYDDLYADPLTWMKEGWIDYLIPQLYWSMDYELASYRKLNDWWSNQSHGTNIYIGNGPYKIRDNADVAWNNPQEINNQIHYSRTLPQIQGNAFFSAKSLFSKNQDVAGLLKEELYNLPTLPPAYQPTKTSRIEHPRVLVVDSNPDFTKVQLERPLDPAIRYAMIQGSDDLGQLSNSHIHTVWVAGSSIRNLEVSSLNTAYLAIRWVDHFGRIVSTQVFQTPKKSRP